MTGRMDRTLATILARAHMLGVLNVSVRYVFDEEWCKTYLGMECLPGHNSPEELALIEEAYVGVIYELQARWFPHNGSK
jgi:hypothetical protein